MPTAVVLGQGMAGATSLAAVRDLGRSGIPVIALSGTRLSPARHSRYCSFRRCPDAEREPAALLDFLIAEARAHGDRCVLFATGDAQAWFVAEHACELRRWFRFADLSRDLLLALLDKYSQFELARSLGVAVPATVCPSDPDEADCVAKQLGFPVFIKPRFSLRWPYLGHNKGFVASNSRELQVRLHWALDAGFQVLVQSIVQGPDTNLRSVYCYAGANGAEVACCYGMLRKYPAGYGFGVFAESVDDPELARLSLDLLRRIGFRGVAELEFKRDQRDGAWRLIEINPRFALQHGLVSAAGVNLASLAYFDLIGAPSETPQYRAGVRWSMAGLDLRASLGQWRRGELGMGQWLRSFRGLRTEALFSRDDPGPALAYLLRGPRYLLEAAFRPPVR